MPAAETVRRLIDADRLDEAASLLDELDEDAERQHLAGVLALRRGRPEEAAGCFTAALAAEPHHAGYLCNLGVAERRRGNLAAAAAAYTQALACDPGRAEAAFNLANVLSEQGHAEAALSAYRRALATAPEWPQFHYNHANLLNSLDRLDEATRGYLRLLRLTAGRHGDAWINLGKVAEKQGHPDFALRCFEHVAAADPGNVSTRWNRALALLLTGRWSEGWREY
ncbi:MAG: tetratricopeptide repeat protein, partial [Rhodospirillales bacterium]|nr:tetratricopeptide repeat protein [Rhodospirillales bacterium]